MADRLIALDQGTTSTRAILFDAALNVLAIEQREFPQHFPRSGWVEHDPEDLFATSVNVIRSLLDKSGMRAGDIAALGITNQRETTIVWERATGRAIHHAIVWQDRPTAPICATLRDEGLEPTVAAATGLLLDPYFSGTKIGWLLDNVPGACERAVRGDLAFGTVDSWLLWRLTAGTVHATDATNASRTLLYDLRQGR